MDHVDIERTIERLVNAEEQAADRSAPRAIFGLRIVTDELAEPVGGDGSATDAQGAAVRMMRFASGTYRVDIAVDNDARQLLGRLTPPQRASVELRSATGETREATADAPGVFSIAEVPTGRAQLVLSIGDPARTLRTAWTHLIDRSEREPVQPRAAPLRDDELLRRRMLRDATPPATGDLEPNVPLVSLTLAPAAQHELRPLPQQRWSSDQLPLQVVLAETSDGRLTVEVDGAPELPDDIIIAVTWSTLATDGDQHETQLVTPLPVASTDRRRAIYDVGASHDVSVFGLGDIAVVPASTISPGDVTDSLKHRPYGNAVRAWDEHTRRAGDTALRAAFAAAVGDEPR